jgi:hypothetical protein
MKPLWISSFILAAMVAILLYNNQHLNHLIEPLKEQLHQAGDLAKEEQWESALQITREVQQTWNDHNSYLHITLPHSNIDEICVMIDEAIAYLETQKIGDYAAVNQGLINQLTLLYEMEIPTLTNIL